MHMSASPRGPRVSCRYPHVHRGRGDSRSSLSKPLQRAAGQGEHATQTTSRPQIPGTMLSCVFVGEQANPRFLVLCLFLLGWGGGGGCGVRPGARATLHGMLSSTLWPIRGQNAAPHYPLRHNKGRLGGLGKGIFRHLSALSPSACCCNMHAAGFQRIQPAGL